MLKDILSYNLDVVFCGTAKGKKSIKKGYYYSGPGNRFYSILFETGLTPHRLDPSECFDIIKYGIGITDLVHSEFGNDNEISESSYDVNGLIRKIIKYKPKYLAFNGKKGAAFVLGHNGNTKKVHNGEHHLLIETTKILVLPSTSGSARRYWDAKYWHLVRDLIK